MEYDDFITEVRKLDFMRDRDAADAAVKAVLGILASRMKEEEAKLLAQKLPYPLTLDKLRSHQRQVITIPVEGYYSEIASQFKLNDDQARMIVHTVLHLAKEAAGEPLIKEIEDALPVDWAMAIEES